jgi:hypothetical protein
MKFKRDPEMQAQRMGERVWRAGKGEDLGVRCINALMYQGFSSSFEPVSIMSNGVIEIMNDVKKR